MKKRKNKPTIKEIQLDLQTVYSVVRSMANELQTLRVLIEHYLNMNKVLINFSNPNSVVSKLIDKYGLGFNIDLNNPESLKGKLENMKSSNEISKILENIKYFQQSVSNKEIAFKSYLELISPSS